METQTRYDLNAAIENWRAELAAQVNLTAEIRRELETHLRDAITGFQQRGLNDEESFWLACKRVGQPPQLGEEFVKADPVKVWRDRIFWMWLGFFLYVTLSQVTGIISYMLTPINSNGRFVGAAELLLAMMPVLTPLIAITTVVILISGNKDWLFRKLEPLVKTRFRVSILAFSIIGLIIGATEVARAMYEMKIKDLHLDDFHPNSHEMLFVGYYPLILALALVWLAPVRNRKTPKRV